MSKNEKTNNVTAQMYDTLVRPVITEKSMLSSEAGKIVFRVPLEASKDEIKAAVEAIFNVKVTKVNTIVRLARPKDSETIWDAVPISRRLWLLLPMVKILMLQQEFKKWC